MPSATPGTEILSAANRVVDDGPAGNLPSLEELMTAIDFTAKRLHRAYESNDRGEVATYIPELAKVDHRLFGIAVTSVAGTQIVVGDAEHPFTIQSCSKPFIFGMALQQHGRDEVLKRIGVEPSGDPFNSIIKLDENGRPHNPCINAGAICASSMIAGDTLKRRVDNVLNVFGDYAGQPPKIDKTVYESERSTGHRNRAIGELMIDSGAMPEPLDLTLDTYFQQCSILTTARELSVIGATLANGGCNPLTDRQAIDPSYVRDVLTVMLTCGMYDWAGQWAYEVGIPAKSGVGGGIVAVVPGLLGIGVFSPRLDKQGNSVRGVQVCRDLARLFNFHILGETIARVRKT